MSNLSAFPMIPERSEATPGLWNNVYSTLSANIAAVDGTLLAGHFQQLSIGSTPPSYATTAAVTIEVNSNQSDYLYLVDSAAQRSSYVIGSRAGGTADGLNIWDASAGTMIASFSKQSVRFYQNLIGPVFDTGGAFYNAASFIGSGSSLSGIQAAINQSDIDGKSGVYVPASMYPYDASRISFIYTRQMVREGGRFDVYDIQAYGADVTGNSASSASNRASVQGALDSASGRGAAFVSAGTCILSSGLLIPSNTEMVGDGWRSVLYFNYVASGASQYLQNKNYPALTGNSNIRLTRFHIYGGGTGIRSAGASKPAGLLYYSVTSFFLGDLRFSFVPGISISYQSCRQGRILGNLVSDGEADGITGWFGCQDIVVGNNTVSRVGDDGISMVGDDGVTFGRAENVVFVGNTIFTQSQYTVPATGRGMAITGCNDVAIVGNAIESTNGDGIRVTSSDNSTAVRATRVLIVGNKINSAGSSGNTLQGTDGISIQSCDYATITGNVISGSSARGVFVLGTKYLDFTGNSVISNGRGIASAAGWGLDIANSNSSFVNIVGNTFSGNAGGGISIRINASGNIANNVIVDNGVTGDGTNNLAAGIYLDGAGGSAALNFNINGNYITDTKAVGSKLQSYAIRGVGLSISSLFIANNYVSGNSGKNIQITGTLPTLLQYGNGDYEAGQQAIGWWSPSAFTAGTALLPGMSFASEVSLGFYRSTTSSIDLTYGSLRFPAGSQLTPAIAFTSNKSTGLIDVGGAGGDYIGLVAGNNAAAYIGGPGIIQLAKDGTALQPSLTLNSEISLGLYRSAVSTMGLSYGALNLPSASNTTPSLGYVSERSLGFYRSANSSVALSYGTLDLTGGGAVTSIASLTIKSGSNNACGTAVLGSNGSVNVANTYVKTGDLIFLTDQTPGGTLGDLEVGGIRNSSGFTIQSTSITDTSTVGWLIIRPG